MIRYFAHPPHGGKTGVSSPLLTEKNMADKTRRRIVGPQGVSLESFLPNNDMPAGIQLKEVVTKDFKVTEATRISPLIEVVIKSPQPVAPTGFSIIRFPIEASSEMQSQGIQGYVTLSSGLILPINGMLEENGQSYQIPLASLQNGWKLGVFHNPAIKVIRPSPALHHTANLIGVETQRSGWLTPTDWETCLFTVINHTGLTEEYIELNYINPAVEACEKLQDTGIRSPRLWIDSRSNPKSRFVHITNQNSYFTSTNNDLDSSFLLSQSSEDDMLALGQIYISHNQLEDLKRRFNVNFENIFIHELSHAAQAGYDIRTAVEEIGTAPNTKKIHALKAYFEGTATPIGQTYQQYKTLSGPDVSPRDLRAGEYMLLDSTVDNPFGNYYTKQSFFAYIAKRYGDGDWAYLHQLFEQLAMAAFGQQGMGIGDYLASYREGMNTAFNIQFEKSLAEIYPAFAEDRAYIHSPHAIFHKIDQQVKPHQLAEFLFNTNEGQEGFKEMNLLLNEQAHLSFAAIKPLSMRAFKIYTPMDQCMENCPETHQIKVKINLTEGTLAPDFIKIVQYEEKLETVAGSPETRKETQDITKPILLSAPHGTSRPFTFLVFNSSVANRQATIQVEIASFIKSVLPRYGSSGDEIVITGLGLGNQDQNVLKWGEIQVDVTEWTDTRIRFRIPDSWATGKQMIRIKTAEDFSNLGGKFSWGIFFPAKPEIEQGTIDYEIRLQKEAGGEQVFYWEAVHQNFAPDFSLEEPQTK